MSMQLISCYLADLSRADRIDIKSSLRKVGRVQQLDMITCQASKVD